MSKIDMIVSRNISHHISKKLARGPFWVFVLKTFLFLSLSSENNFNLTVFLLSAKKTICLFRAVFLFIE